MLPPAPPAHSRSPGPRHHLILPRTAESFVGVLLCKRAEAGPSRAHTAPVAAPKERAFIEPLIAQLQANLGRVVDLFRSWDTDASGSVTKKEFRKGIASALKVEPTLEELAALFSFLDPDGSGSIDYRELDAKLHRRNVRHAP